MIQEEVRGLGLDLAVSGRAGREGPPLGLPVCWGWALWQPGSTWVVKEPQGTGLFAGTLTGSSVSLVLD